MKPHVICLMITSPDGSLHPSRWTKSPDGERSDWTALYEKIHTEHAGNAWMVGRVTMAEMSKAKAHPPTEPVDVARPHHFARPGASTFAIALDPSGKLHFSGDELFGDHIVVLLGPDVPDSHLAELAGDGVSYVVSDKKALDLHAMLTLLGQELGITRILLEGGASVNGSMLAAGLVDEISLVIAPALEGRADSDRVIAFGEEGLAGKVELSLKSCDVLAHGAIHVRYDVRMPS
ncbi:riboflavin biosynthesis pyrimidine reductase [Rhizobium sp. PP-F2F-G38]|uniref:RibD family protein n=1 Tax=Ferranicluibacter rubi TaxID=2715133 RepID=A0AA44CAD1_9HYPH|nr:dihydrofolate reductase family protein [Ferranicluibacter rubi]NHT75783.1 RibD family protein [Ferranicluibacter rubi]PYE95968.1 riboflavin biosynthesis pyrimidine reductase [Rhizobium sp. PP-F2F-G38]TCP88427.1 riboflavin biosynthesis pyrimidine reductase [Rhizobium sp. PP-CC-2G-626]TCQ22908.1 riboflavin biosynthesis pyrimidine reductase [Rhizobium sp. PP-CC-3G-465]